jgi:hypothetical protein
MTSLTCTYLLTISVYNPYFVYPHICNVTLYPYDMCDFVTAYLYLATDNIREAKRNAIITCAQQRATTT